MSAFNVVIPARYASQRLPGKPLRDIRGVSMIQHVHRRAMESGARHVVIATDDERIRSHAEAFGAQVVMTSASHESGTERIVEVVQRLDWSDDTVVVNLQGDEPLMPPVLLERVAATLASRAEADVATLAVPLDDKEQLFDPNCVKVVTDRSGHAMYFSRATIPWQRDRFRTDHAVMENWLSGVCRHLGIYAYSAGFLRRYAELAVSPLEQAESLEQLRVLWNGGRIAVELIDRPPPAGVDTEQDLRRVEAALSGSSD